MSIDSGIEGFLTSGGAPAAKFPSPGTVVKGTIISAELSQQTDMVTGAPSTWPDGKPKMQVIVTLQTEERDSSIDDDSGVRRVFVKGGMQAALREALKAAGSGLAEGGTLAIKYTGDGERTKPGFNPPKLYQASYKAPTLDLSALGTDDLL